MSSFMNHDTRVKLGLVMGSLLAVTGGVGIVALALGGPACTAVPPCAVNGLCVPDMTAYDAGVDLSATPQSFTLLSPSIAGSGSSSFLGVGEFGGEADVLLAVPGTTDLGAGTELLRYSAVGAKVAGLYPLSDRVGNPLTVSLMAAVLNGSSSLGADLALAYSKAGSNFLNLCPYSDYSAGGCSGPVPLGTATVSALAAGPSGGTSTLVALGTSAAVTVYDADLYPTTYNLGAIRALAVADLNADGKPDVVVVSAGSTSGGDAGAAAGLTVLLNNGDVGVGWTFAQSAVTCDNCVAGMRETLLLADVDGKNGPDLVLADLTTLHVLLNQGGGRFGAQIDLDLGVKLVEDGGAFAVGDVVGDSNPDLIILRPTTAHVELYAGGGDGTFSGMLTIAADATNHLVMLGAPPYGVVLADFNGDKKNDLAATSASGLQVLLGKP